MTVCSYYLRGACKYGDRCRNEHPGAVASFGNQAWTSTGNRILVPYTVESVTADVTPDKDKPLWPLSSYGPSKHEPLIISGLDESPEELRLKALVALRAGTTDEYTKYEAEKTSAADQLYTNARNNIKQLYGQALKASAQSQISESDMVSSVPASTTSVPSAFGVSNPSAFGKPAFGQPTFGQSGFGSTSGTLGQGTQAPSAFGAPTQPVSAFGQSIQAASPFGPTTQTTTSAFGQPSGLGAASQQPTSVFGKASQPTSVFGQASQPTSAFGQPSQLTSAFAQPAPPASAFSQSPQPASAFGQTSQQTFGQSSFIKPASGAFGGTNGGGFSAFTPQASTFTSAAAQSSPATSPMPGQSTFGSTTPIQSAFGTITSAPKSAFGATQPSPIGTSSFSNLLTVPAMSSPASAIGGGGPFATSPMTVTPSNEKPASGTPDFAGAKSTAKMRPGADRYLALLPDDYNDIMPADVKAAFASAKFGWGKIPEWIPPEAVR